LKTSVVQELISIWQSYIISCDIYTMSQKKRSTYGLL